MGIRDFTKVFKSTRQVKFKDIADLDLAVDAYLELFRTSSMQHSARLTNPSGEPTLHLNIALANAVKRKVLGADDIWCWDSRDPRKADDPKQKVLADRAEIRKTNLDEIKRIEADIAKYTSLTKKFTKAEILKIDPTYDASLKAKQDQLEMLKARNPNAQHFSKMITDVQFILTKLGIRMAIAPVGCDAEHLAARLCIDGICDGVITTDTDAIIRGAPRQFKKVPGKPGVYDEYTLESCLSQHKITQVELVKIATALGCDFCDKTSGVGPATVVKKVKDNKLEFTQEQIAAQKNFLDNSKIQYQYLEPVCTNESLDELHEWLVTKQGFNSDRMKKLLAPLYG